MIVRICKFASKHRDKVEALFERLLAVRDDLGLSAVEYESESGVLLGNFPQAFSHVGLVNTAFNQSGTCGWASQTKIRGPGPIWQHDRNFAVSTAQLSAVTPQHQCATARIL
jgi:hypothetical protein